MATRGTARREASAEELRTAIQKIFTPDRLEISIEDVYERNGRQNFTAKQNKKWLDKRLSLLYAYKLAEPILTQDGITKKRTGLRLLPKGEGVRNGGDVIFNATIPPRTSQLSQSQMDNAGEPEWKTSLILHLRVWEKAHSGFKITAIEVGQRIDLNGNPANGKV